MSINGKRPGVALISVILISAILVTGAAIALTRAGTEKQITSSDVAFREALSIAETGVANVISSMRLNNTDVLPVNWSNWAQFLEFAQNGESTTLTPWKAWLFNDEAGALVTRGAFVTRVTTSAAQVVAGQDYEIGSQVYHTYDTPVIIAALGRTFAPSVAPASVTNPASRFVAQRAIAASTVIRWRETIPAQLEQTETTPGWTTVNAAVFSDSSITLAGAWGVIKGDVHSNSIVDVQDNGGSITEGVITGTGGVTGKWAPSGSGYGPPIPRPNFAAARDDGVISYQDYVSGKAPWNGTGGTKYENTAAALAAGPGDLLYPLHEYLTQLQATPADTALWTHEGAAYYAASENLGTVNYKGEDVKGVNLKSNVTGGTIVIDGSLIMDGGSITADLVVVTGDIIRANGGGTIHGAVLVQGGMKGNGNFSIYGSLISGGHLDLSGSILIDHTGGGSVEFPSTTTVIVPAMQEQPATVLGAFLSDAPADRKWRESLPSDVLVG